MQKNDLYRLMGTGVFRKKAQIIEYLLMDCLRENDKPVGSYVLKNYLDSRGANSSTATVGRYLKDLDDQGYTVRHSNQGRLLTPLGRSHIHAWDEKLERIYYRNAISDAMNISKYEELLDMIRIRVALETEMTRQAAQRAKEEDIAYIYETLARHQQAVDANLDPTDTALEFHLAVAKASHNKSAIAIFDLLILEEKRVEKRFEELVTRERGGVYVVDHKEIAEEIKNKNADNAANLMAVHVEDIYINISRQVEEMQQGLM